MTLATLDAHIVASGIFDNWGSVCINHKAATTTTDSLPHGVKPSTGAIYGYSDEFNTAGYMYLNGITDKRINRRLYQYDSTYIVNIFEKKTEIVQAYDKAKELHAYLSARGVNVNIQLNAANCEHCDFCSLSIILDECKKAT